MGTDAASLHVEKHASMRWLHGVIAIVALVLLIGAQTIRQIVVELGETKDGIAQAVFIAAVSAWIVWRRREALSRVAARPLPQAIIAVVMLSLLWAVAERAGIAALSQFCIPLLMWMAILAVYGFRFARTIGFAFAYIGFALPLWSVLTPVLQDASVHATRVALDLTSIPAFVHGNFFDLPAGTFEIETGCAGLHFFVAGLGLAALMGEVNGESKRNRLVLMLSGAALAILGNWIRIYCVILAGYLTDMQHYLVRVDHYWFGWGLFGLTMGLLALIARRLPLSKKQEDSNGPQGHPARLNYKLLVPVACSLAVGPALSMARPIRPAPSLSLLAPVGTVSWPRVHESQSDWLPSFEGADGLVRETYGSQEHIDLFAAAYGYQQQGKELSGYANRLTSAGEYAVVQATHRHADQEYTVIHVKDARGRLETIWYTYVVGQRVFTSAALQQLYYAIRTFAEPVQSSVIALRAPCRSECEAVDHSIEEFVRSMPISSITTPRSS